MLQDPRIAGPRVRPGGPHRSATVHPWPNPRSGPLTLIGIGLKGTDTWVATLRQRLGSPAVHGSVPGASGPAGVQSHLCHLLAILIPMREVVLEEVIIQFDGSVVELFYVGRGDSDRFHVAQLESAELLRLDSSRGPTLNLAGKQRGGVSLTHLKLGTVGGLALQEIVAEINRAIP